MPLQAHTLNKFVAIRPSTSANLRQVEAPVAASQTIKKHDLLVLSSGKVAQALADPGSDNAVTSSNNTSLYGVALGDITTGASPTASDVIPVAVFDDNLELLIRLFHATPASAVLSALTRGAAYQFGRYRKTAGQLWYVALTTTTTPEMTFVENVEPTANRYGIGVFKLIPAKRQAN